MKNSITKISLLFLIGLIIIGCNATKRVPEGKSLLTDNNIFVNAKKNNQEEVYAQLHQKQNTSIFGYPLRLNIYNLAKPKTDSLFRARLSQNPKKYEHLVNLLSKKQVKRLSESFYYLGIHNFLRKTGEAPVILDTSSIRKSTKRLRSYYFNKGYFDVTANHVIDSIAPKKTKVRYNLNLGKPYLIDSTRSYITSPVLDSIYQLRKNNSFIKTGKRFETKNFEEEKNRITTDFRDNGAFRFQQNYVTFDIDSSKSKHITHVNLVIEDENIRVGDSIKTEPFKLYKISKVNIFTDHDPSDPYATITDSTAYKDFTLYSVKKLKYRPKAIADGVFINKDNYFSDNKTVLTSKYLSNLSVFNYPLIQYTEDKKQENGLIANIYLKPRDKYTFRADVDFSHSNIQDFGIAGYTSVTIRNVFKGAETLELSVRGEIGSSSDAANPNDNFFNISEIGADAKLNFPRLFLPFKTDKIIPKTMLPHTTFSLGSSKQTNIGLDKQNLTNSFSYYWTPKKNTSFRLDLLNIQYVRNINPDNYYTVYESSYNELNDLAQKYNADPSYFDDKGNLIIPEGVENFLDDVNQGSIVTSTEDKETINSIEEQQQRLTENNLIFATNISFSKSSKKDLLDNSFYTFRAKFESAGNFLSLLTKAANQEPNTNGSYSLFGVTFSQYLKGELEFIKHWDLSRKKVFATRAFFGVAIPYGNMNSVPFSRSYFGGGSNDIRAWQPYSLGPGKTESVNDYNEANMKMTVNAELRFPFFFQQLNAALFIDAGNIWHVSDIVTNPDAVFSGIKSFENTAIGSGFGFNYDFNFFVIRLDFGFKTYNPARPENEKWFKEMRFDKTVLNIGINYPF